MSAFQSCTYGASPCGTSLVAGTSCYFGIQLLDTAALGSNRGRRCSNVLLLPDSRLLDDLIKQSRADTAAYEKFLRNAEARVTRLAEQHSDDGVPAVLHGKPEAVVLFNNLSSLDATNFCYPTDDDDKAAL